MNWKTSIFLLLFSGLLIFLTFNRHKHSKNGYFNYQSEIWADKAGYNVYLPATFMYGFDAAAFPESIDSLTGNGFRLDQETKIMHTKYTYGVAFMQAPFFLLAYGYSNILGQPSNGYNPIYHAIVNISAVFFLVMGLFFLFKFLSFQYSWSTSFVAVAILFLGTNLYFYSIDDTGMSHVYSFFLFALYLYILRKSNYLEKLKTSNLIIIGLISSLMLLIRPTSAVFLLVFIFLDVRGKNEISNRLQNLFKAKPIFIFILSFMIIWLPQFLYWKYSTGNYFSYTYTNEGFSFLNPKLHYTWFSPLNGLFLYTPLYLLVIFGIVKMIQKRIANGWVLLVLFLVISFVFSSWWDWSFGCSFGARSFVEYLAIFVLPIAYILSQHSDFTLIQKIFLIAVVVALIAFNLKLTYTYDSCFFGKGVWDWSEYRSLITSPTK